MQVDGAPSSIFTIKQLFWTLQFIVIVFCGATIGATPVLDDIPVSAFEDCE